MFGIWSSARSNKETIFYTIVTIFLLERVRTGCNRIESKLRKLGASKDKIERTQNRLIVGAALLYAIPLVLPMIRYIYRSIEELSWSVSGLLVLKNTWAFFGFVVVTECFLAIVLYNLLKIYVDRMNTAVGFFTKIGRNMWDGSKMAVRVSSNASSRVVGTLKGASTRAWSATKSVSALSVQSLRNSPTKARTLGRKTFARFGRRTIVEGSRS